MREKDTFKIMKIAVLINDFKTLQPSQTTAMLIQSAVNKNHEVFIFSVTDFIMNTKDEVCASARYIDIQQASLPLLVSYIQTQKSILVHLESFDCLLIRTNPARAPHQSWAHHTSLLFSGMLKDRGVLVLNDPDGLKRASNKIYLSDFPKEVKPPTFISCIPQELKKHIEETHNACVLKPLHGTRGQDVFFLWPNQHTNLNQIIDVVTRNGFAMVQEFLPEAELGDIRVVVMDGNVLEIDGEVAAVHRVPCKGELRSNIHQGGFAQKPIITKQMRTVAKQVGSKLKQDGIFLAGLDFIGSKLVEINVFSTGGLRDADKFTGHSFANLVLQSIETKIDTNKQYSKIQ